jgi:hypothetical protein
MSTAHDRRRGKFQRGADWGHGTRVEESRGVLVLFPMITDGGGTEQPSSTDDPAPDKRFRGEAGPARALRV